jgi:hypothetical protein
MRENAGCGREQARGILRELCENGYGEQTQTRQEDGRFATGYVIRAIPEPVTSAGETSALPGAAEPYTVERGAADPSAEEEPQEVEPREEEPLPERQAPAALSDRRVDRVWEFLYLVETGRTYEPGTPLTPNLRSRLNAARAQARIGGFDEVDLERAVAGWAAAMGESRITANALVTNAVRCLSAIEGAAFSVPRQAVEAAIRAGDAPRRQAEQERLRAWMEGNDA